MTPSVFVVLKEAAGGVWELATGVWYGSRAEAEGAANAFRDKYAAAYRRGPTFKVEELLKLEAPRIRRGRAL